MSDEYLQDLKRDLCECRFNRSDFIHQQWLNAINELEKENKELNSKIDKAIELIECSKEHKLEHDGSHIYLTRYCIDELLEILKDSDVDEGVL